MTRLCSIPGCVAIAAIVYRDTHFLCGRHAWVWREELISVRASVGCGAVRGAKSAAERLSQQRRNLWRDLLQTGTLRVNGVHRVFSHANVIGRFLDPKESIGVHRAGEVGQNSGIHASLRPYSGEVIIAGKRVVPYERDSEAVPGTGRRCSVGGRLPRGAGRNAKQFRADGCNESALLNYGLRDYGTAGWTGGVEGCDHKRVPAEDHAAHAATSTLRGSKRNVGNALSGFGDGCHRCGATRIDNQIGLEPTPAAYIADLVAVFREVRRVLRDDGTCWLNLGDSYAGAGYSNHANTGGAQREDGGKQRHTTGTGFKPKDPLMIPHRVAIALQDDGWWVRSDIVWAKPNPMPESVLDRPTRSHEYIFLLAKSETYYYDWRAIAESSVDPESHKGMNRRSHSDAFIDSETDRGYDGHRTRAGIAAFKTSGKKFPFRNKRDVWTINVGNSDPTAHYATFPIAIPNLCIQAGSKPGDVVLDPFAGSGTTLRSAATLGRRAWGIELNPAYAELCVRRMAQQALELTS